MIIFWSIGYGIIYSVAEKMSIQIGSPHKITAFALFIFLCGCFIVLLKNKKANLWRIKLPSTKSWIITLPLLILPIMNICLLFFLPLKSVASPSIWYLMTVIFTAISEELLFRGYLLVLLSHFFRKSILLTAVTNSIIFGGFHFLNMISGGDFYATLVQVVYAISISFAFVIITVKTDSIFPCMLVHCLVNANSVLQKEIVLNAETIVAYAAVCACYVLYGMALYYKSYRKKRWKKDETLH